MHTAKRPAIRRLLTIDRHLRAGSFPTVEQLAQSCDVKSKTIRRDLEHLRNQLKAPVAYCRERRGWHYTSPTYFLPALLITEGELIGLFLAEKFLQEMGTPHLETHLARAVEKLSELLPDVISIDRKTIEATQSYRNSVRSLYDIDAFRRLSDAVIGRRQLRIRYWTAARDAETERVMDPWHLRAIDGAWYVIAWCHLRKARRLFSCARIRSLQETGDLFTVPSDFNVDEFFHGTFKVLCDDGQPLKQVRLRFAPSAAKYVREKIWHASQTLVDEADGGAIVELSVRSLIEVRRWVLSWGSECEVLAPNELCHDIAREVAIMMERLPLEDTGRDGEPLPASVASQRPAMSLEEENASAVQ